MTAAAPPPAAVLAAMEASRLSGDPRLRPDRGLWPGGGLRLAGRVERLAERSSRPAEVAPGRQLPGAGGPHGGRPESLEPVPRDGETLGEVFMRGNIVMKRLPEEPRRPASRPLPAAGSTAAILGVWHPDGYIELKDRSKDIIISGGENISSIEVEDVLYKHPAVATAAVVARPDEKWGETPCAFVELQPGQEVSSDDIIAHCRANLARYKVPRHVVFGTIPKTSTGKIQKFKLREQAQSL